MVRDSRLFKLEPIPCFTIMAIMPNNNLEGLIPQYLIIRLESDNKFDLQYT